jgi:hypothetical protein
LFLMTRLCISAWTSRSLWRSAYFAVRTSPMVQMMHVMTF